MRRTAGAPPPPSSVISTAPSQLVPPITTHLGGPSQHRNAHMFFTCQASGPASCSVHRCLWSSQRLSTCDMQPATQPVREDWSTTDGNTTEADNGDGRTSIKQRSQIKGPEDRPLPWLAKRSHIKSSAGTAGIARRGYPNERRTITSSASPKSDLKTR